MGLRGAVLAAACAVLLTSCTAPPGGGNPDFQSVQPQPATSTVTVTPTPQKLATKITEINPLDDDGNVRNAYTVDKLGKDDKTGLFPLAPDVCSEPSLYGDSPGTYSCEYTALSADACWLEQSSDLVCIYYPWDTELSRLPLKQRLENTRAPENPAPLAMELGDGSRYRALNAAGNSTRADGLQEAYDCVEGPCRDNDFEPWILGGDDNPIVDQTTDAWTVRVGANSGKPELRDVSRAWFITTVQ